MALRGEGFYALHYVGSTGGWGLAMLAFETGKVFGVDIGGVRYTGDYQVDANNISATLTLTIPAGIALVTGLPGESEGTERDADREYPAPGWSGNRADVAWASPRSIDQDR